jgi:uncharacterized protein DUF4430
MTPACGTAAVLALCAMAAAGCGLGPGSSSGEVELTISRDYGRQLISQETEESRQSDTVIRILDRQAEIETRYGGGFVQSIEGLSGGERDGRRFDWFFYVNGIESPVGSADYRPEGGDRIWWDYRDWSSAMRVPAVVGSFPEPFLHGFEGDHWDADVVCLTLMRTCDLVDDRLADSGVQARVVRDPADAADGAIRVLVGPWGRIRSDSVASLLAEAPDRSGVFARFDRSGLALLDEQGSEASSYAGDAGLIAALRPGEGPPTWVVTGTDAASVGTLAAPVFGEELHDRYAIAVTSERGVVELPAVGESG